MIVEALMAVLIRLREESALSIVLVEQNSRVALAFSPRTVVMDKGRIVYDGPSAALAADPERLTRFIGLAEVTRRPGSTAGSLTAPCGRTTLRPFRFGAGRIRMTVYEMRTYTLHVGKMGEAVKLYTEFGYPALQKGGQDKKLIGYFQADTGTINQLVHLWKFDDDADRRTHWAAVFANKDFVEGFAVKFRPLLASQEVKLLTAAPWGPHP